MKTPILIPLLLTATLAYPQRWSNEAGFNYAFTLPQYEMRQNIAHGHGFQFDFGKVNPAGKIALGLDVSYTGYGRDVSTQQYVFPDGLTADASVIVNNSFARLQAFFRFYLPNLGPVSPYAIVKAGYALFSTNLNIYDPDDQDQCAPVESELLQHDGTFVYSAGGGVRWDIAQLFARVPEGTFYLDLNATLTQGGRVSYMNSNGPDPMYMGQSDRIRDVEAEFINTQTLVIHRHHVGYLYSSFARMLDFRFGFVFRPNSHTIVSRRFRG